MSTIDRIKTSLITSELPKVVKGTLALAALLVIFSIIAGKTFLKSQMNVVSGLYFGGGIPLAFGATFGFMSLVTRVLMTLELRAKYRKFSVPEGELIPHANPKVGDSILVPRQHPGCDPQYSFGRIIAVKNEELGLYVCAYGNLENDKVKIEKVTLTSEQLYSGNYEA